MAIKSEMGLVSRRAVLKGGVAVAASVALGRVAWAADEGGSIPAVRLANGVMMPRLGFGTFRLRGDVCTESVADAIAAGYRLVDTATVYENEEAVGAGIKKSGVDRRSLFVTSKVWVADAGYERAKKAFQDTLDKMQLEYLDLWLIHRPHGDFQGSWRAMEELNAAGKIRAIGVSNFDQAQIASLGGKTQPVVNQIETHPYFQEATEYRALHGSAVQMEAWAPFAEGRNGMFTNATLMDVGKKHGKTVAQTVLRWHYQRGVVAIPRSSNAEHRRENLGIFDFALDGDDMRRIAGLDLNKSQFPEWT